MKNSLNATFFVKVYFNPKSGPSEVSATKESNDITADLARTIEATIGLFNKKLLAEIEKQNKQKEGVGIWEGKLNTHKENVANFDKNIADLTAKKTEFEGQKATLEGEKSTLESQEMALVGEWNGLISETKALTQKTRDETANLRAATQKRNGLRAEYNRVKSENPAKAASLYIQLQAAEGNVQRGIAQVEAATRAMNAKAEEMNAKEKEVQQKGKEIEEKKGEIEKKSAEIDVTNKEIETNQAEKEKEIELGNHAANMVKIYSQNVTAHGTAINDFGKKIADLQAKKGDRVTDQKEANVEEGKRLNEEKEEAQAQLDAVKNADVSDYLDPEVVEKRREFESDYNEAVRLAESGNQTFINRTKELEHSLKPSIDDPVEKAAFGRVAIAVHNGFSGDPKVLFERYRKDAGLIFGTSNAGDSEAKKRKDGVVEEAKQQLQDVQNKQRENDGFKTQTGSIKDKSIQSPLPKQENQGMKGDNLPTGVNTEMSSSASTDNAGNEASANQEQKPDVVVAPQNIGNAPGDRPQSISQAQPENRSDTQVANNGNFSPEVVNISPAETPEVPVNSRNTNIPDNNKPNAVPTPVTNVPDIPGRIVEANAPTNLAGGVNISNNAAVQEENAKVLNGDLKPNSQPQNKSRNQAIQNSAKISENRNVNSRLNYSDHGKPRVTDGSNSGQDVPNSTEFARIRNNRKNQAELRRFTSDPKFMQVIEDTSLLRTRESSNLKALINKIQSSQEITKQEMDAFNDELVRLVLFDVFNGLKEKWNSYSDKTKIPENEMVIFRNFATKIVGANIINDRSGQIRMGVLDDVYEKDRFKTFDLDRSKIREISGKKISDVIQEYGAYTSKTQVIVDNAQFFDVIEENVARLAVQQSNKDLYNPINSGLPTRNKPLQVNNMPPPDFVGPPNPYDFINTKKKGPEQPVSKTPFLDSITAKKSFAEAFPNVSMNIGGRMINAAAPQSKESFMEAFNNGEYIALTNLIPAKYMSNIPEERQNKEPLLMQQTSKGVFTEYVGNRFPITSSRDGPKATMLHVELTRHHFTEKIFRSPYHDSLHYFEKNFAKKFPDRRPEDDSWRFQESIFQEIARVSGISEFNVSGQLDVERLLFKLNDPDFYKPLEARMRETGMMDESGKITEATMRKSENFTKMNTGQKSQDSTEKGDQNEEKNQDSTKDTSDAKPTNVDNMNDNTKTTRVPNSDPLSFLA